MLLQRCYSSLRTHFIRQIAPLNSPTGLLSSDLVNLVVSCVIQSDGAVRENLISLPLANHQSPVSFPGSTGHIQTAFVWMGEKKQAGPTHLTFGRVNAGQKQTKHFMSMHISPDINTYVLP